MEDIILPALVVGAVTFVVIMLAFFIARAFGKGKMRAFQEYVKQNFPDLPDTVEMYGAKQKSKGIKLDIALLMDETKKEIILLFDNKGEPLAHKLFPYDELTAVDISDRIIERGISPKTYSYERTLALKFKDGSSYSLVAEMVSNKYGNDKGADFIRNSFAPWEKKLNNILDNS